MRSPLKYQFFVVCCLILLGSCSNKNRDLFSDKNWISLAVESEEFIRQSKYESPEGPIWKVMPDSVNSQADNSLYSGVPGIVLFYLELYNTTGNSNYLDEAESGAAYLINTIKDTIYNAGEVGLYTGLAGIGFAINEVYKTTGDPLYYQASVKIVDQLEAAASRTENGINWGQITDIVYGGAGIGLYLQYVSDEFNLPKADSLSILAAEGLLDNAIDTLNGLRWKFMPDYERYMDNFSHGTAGTAYFLSETYLRTKNEKYLDAAIKAANLLDGLSNDKGYIPHHLPGGEDLYYLNWCHGPAGTGRLFYSLYEATNDEAWLEKMTRTADYLMEEGIDQHEAPGFWNNEGKCCGSAGVAEYFLWLYNITGNEKYLGFSGKMTKKLIASSTKEGDCIKWIQAENRRSPENVAAQTGLMQGSAGIGLWFLQLNAFQNNKEPTITLPDKPIVGKGF